MLPMYLLWNSMTCMVTTHKQNMFHLLVCISVATVNKVTVNIITKHLWIKLGLKELLIN